MKTRNHYIYGTDEQLKNLEVEYAEYCGRDVRREPGRLIVLALPVKPIVEQKQVRRRPRRESE